MKNQQPSFDESTEKAECFLFLSLPRHDGQYTSTPWQLARELSVDNQVIFIDHPFTFLDLLTGFWKPQIIKRLKAYGKAFTLKKDGVDVVLAPFVWPTNFLPKGKMYNLVSRWNQKMLAARINSFLKKKKIAELIYVNSFNFYFPKLQQYLSTSVKQVIYHCIDPMVKAFTLKHGIYLQTKAAHNADFVVSTAPALQKPFAYLGLKSYLVPNAANFDLFNLTESVSIHPSVAHVKGKVLGYIGNIERRTDFNLLRTVVDALPDDWSIVMAGPVERQYVPVEFLNHRRVHFTGPVKHYEAPAVVKRFDVCMIPFKCDEVSSGIYPLKLYEYLATGKPVVSSDFNPEVLSGLKEVVRVTEGNKSFAEAVLLAYTTDSSALASTRIAVAKDNTWTSRARLFKSISSIELKNKYKLTYVAQAENQK